MRENTHTKRWAQVFFLAISAVSLLLAVRLAQRNNVSIAQLSICILSAFAVVAGLVPTILNVQLKIDMLSRELDTMKGGQQR